MSGEVGEVLATATDAAGTPVPAEFEEWVRARTTRRDDSPTPTPTTDRTPPSPSGMTEYDLGELLTEGGNNVA